MPRSLITVSSAPTVMPVVLWLAALAVLDPHGSTLTDAASIVPHAIWLVHRLGRDDSLGRGIRVRLSLLLIYVGIPIDLVPDFTPVPDTPTTQSSSESSFATRCGMPA
jgi:hypothetical protein